MVEQVNISDGVMNEVELGAVVLKTLLHVLKSELCSGSSLMPSYEVEACSLVFLDYKNPGSYYPQTQLSTLVMQSF